MLSKKFRLPIQGWLKDKKKKVFTQKTDFFAVKFSRNNLDFSRFGVVISSRVSKSAVRRNAIKRAIFNFIKQKKYFETPGNDVLFIVYSQANNLKKNELEQELEKVFK